MARLKYRQSPQRLPGLLFGSDRTAEQGRHERGGDGWRSVVRGRLLWAAVWLAVWTVAIEARLVYLQIFSHQELASRAERQQNRTVTAPGKRGEILDRRGRVLAFSVDADSVYAVPSEIQDAEAVARQLCEALDDCTEKERATIAERLGRQRAFAYVRRQVSPDEAHRVEALALDGVGFLKETRRYYPNRQLAAHLLGYVGTDNTGLHGVEAAYDGIISGRPGKILIQTDAKHRAFSRIERPPTAGATLELTIDEVLQHIAERELRAAVEEHGAKGGTAVIMDPHTGEILALANEPTFNPNVFGRYPEAHRRNRATQTIYEPGSTFKMVTAAAALEEDVIEPSTPVDVSPGYIRFGSRQIDDVSRYGVLSFTDVIVKSSNVGAIKVGLMLGPDRLGRYIRRFGFGQTLSRDFQGESAGIVWDPADLSDSALASVSMGYQIGVTPLQMITATSAIANGGELVEPRLVRAVVRDGRRTDVQRRVIRETISRPTVDRLTAVMEAVVQRGTGRAAQVPGYRVAGKSGTAAKLVDGRYSKTEYNASFAGFLPADKPAIAVLVVIDSPHGQGYYGGAVAAPVFRRIAEAGLRYLGIPPTEGPGRPVLLVQEDRGGRGLVPAAATQATVRRTMASFTHPSGHMPDLLGLSAREAVRTLLREDAQLRIHGRGFVVEQDPAPGVPIERGVIVSVRLSRRPPERPAETLLAGAGQ